MTRWTRWSFGLVAMLSLALPLAQAHCAWMATPVAKPSARAMDPSHACCAAPSGENSTASKSACGPAPKPAPAPDDDACACFQLPPATATAVPSFEPPRLSPLTIAVAIVEAAVVTPPPARERVGGRHRRAPDAPLVASLTLRGPPRA